jgi:hypothetical protein
LLALDLVLEVIDDLDPVGYLGHFGQRRVQADARADRQGRGKADPVELSSQHHRFVAVLQAGPTIQR